MPAAKSFSVPLRDGIRFSVVVVSGASLAYALWKWLNSDDGSCNKKAKRKNIPPGLVNTGNTCFMNVLLQSFAGTSTFISWNKSFSSLVETEDRKYLASTLQEVVDVINGEVETEFCYDPSKLLQAMAGRGWLISSEEQDSHEFFHALMTTMNEEYLHFCRSDKLFDFANLKELCKLPTKRRTYLSDIGRQTHNSRYDPPFHGSLASALQCQTCGFLNPVRCDGFDSVSLPLGNSLLSNVSLMDCLKKFMTADIIQGVDCENCGRTLYAKEKESDNICSNPEQSCSVMSTVRQPVSARTHATFSKLLRGGESQNNFEKKKNDWISDSTHSNGANPPALLRCDMPRSCVKRTFKRHLYFAKLPQCLCVHLQRLVWVGGNPVKVTNYVHFPEVLDVSSFTYNAGLLHGGIFSKRNGMSADSPAPKVDTRSYTLPHPCKKQMYRLTSVIVHVGDWRFSGHFFAYIRRKNSDHESEWIFTSDTLIRKASRDEVFSSRAYMLFYERINDDEHLNCAR